MTTLEVRGLEQLKRELARVARNTTMAMVRTGVRLRIIQPGKPIQDAFVASFIGGSGTSVSISTGSGRSPRQRADLAVQDAYANPSPITRAAIRALLDNPFYGRRPVV
jgi:hypothetical protein